MLQYLHIQFQNLDSAGTSLEPTSLFLFEVKFQVY